VTEGLLGKGIMMEGLDAAKQEGTAGAAASDEIVGSDASHPALSTKIEVLPFDGMRIGAAAYFQPQAFDSLPAGAAGKFLMVMLDARYERGPFRNAGRRRHVLR